MKRDGVGQSSDRERLVTDLSRADAYPHAAEPVTRIETHTADIFLAGGFAYKVKKPVNFGFCDFSTLEKRRHFTFRERELNRDLTNGVYLGVSTVTRDPDGRHTVDGSGETVEYALRMRRLGDEDALDARISAGEVDAGTMRLVAGRVAAFHRKATVPGDRSDSWTLPAVRSTVMSNLDRVEEYAGEFVDTAVMSSVRAYSDAWLAERGRLIDHRFRNGHPRECHGDMHAGNIFLERDASGETVVQIIDCIEFNDSLRIIDPAADIAFLLMDLRRLGRTDLADAFLAEYISASADPGVVPLLPFYTTYRASVRCMANGLIARAASPARRAAAIESSQRYLGLAAECAADDLPSPLLVVMSGMTGTGKSTVARILAEAWGLDHLQTDVIRKELAGLQPLARTSGDQRNAMYSRQMSQRTYAEMHDRAERALRGGRGVIVDGTYLGRQFRRSAVEIGRKAGAAVLIVEVTLAEETVLQRLAARYATGASVSEGSPEVYVGQKPQWERVLDDEADAVARIDTGRDGQSLAAHVLREAWGAVLRAAPAIRPAT